MTIGNSHQKRMLVVDDEEGITFSLVSFFSDAGYEVCSACDRDDALGLLDHQEFDVVIADLRLTGTIGNEGKDVVRVARERSPRAAIVLLTAYGGSEAANEAMRLGADLMLQKPQALPELAMMIRNLLDSDRRVPSMPSGSLPAARSQRWA